MDFQINTQIRSIDDFNKLFGKRSQEVGNSLGSPDEFEGILNSKIEESNKNYSNRLSGGIQMNIGPDAINAQKIENLSGSEKTARDIGNAFSEGINSLNAAQKNAEDAVETLATGGDISIHEVMIASQKSSLAMQMAIQLRNQMVNAYTEFKNLRM